MEYVQNENDSSFVTNGNLKTKKSVVVERVEPIFADMAKRNAERGNMKLLQQRKIKKKTVKKNSEVVKNLLRQRFSKKHKNAFGNAVKLTTKFLLPCDSVSIGKAWFSKLIFPVSVKTFFRSVWEKRPLHIARCNPSFYTYVCTMEDFSNALAKGNIYFTENIDVTTYISGVKVMESHSGKATPELVRELCEKGRSIRLLNPQTFIKKVQVLSSKLQEYFRCFVGANIYFTPGNSQGFAPHYDDVEAFVLQLAGRKEWKVYNPRPGEDLPRFSSPNLTDASIGEPILKVILRPGDLLYFPRGFIHQARALEEGSMHITVSCYQKNSWADFLEKLLPVALQMAVESDIDYRKGLPKNYLDHLGLVASDKKSTVRKKIMRHLNMLVHKLTNYLPIDSCADQFGKKFIHDALPPTLDEDELIFSAENAENNAINKFLRKWKKLKVKLIRAYTCRLVCEDEKFKLYYNTKNGLTYHEVDHQFIRLNHVTAAVVETLFLNYPNFISVKELLLSVGGEENSKCLLVFLKKAWKRGIVVFNTPLYTNQNMN